MQTVIKAALIAIGVYLAILLFLPEKELFFALEAQLAKRHVFINELRITDRFAGLRIDRSTIYFDGLPVAHVRQAEASTMLWQSRLQIKSIELNASIRDMIPIKRIERITVTHRIDDPKHYRVTATTDQGVLEAVGSIADRTLRFYAKDDANITQALKRQVKRDQKGWFYEIAF